MLDLVVRYSRPMSSRAETANSCGTKVHVRRGLSLLGLLGGAESLGGVRGVGRRKVKCIVEFEISSLSLL
eukprot:COSAG06_NODE_45892_length_351_cov_0.805556_1_plen_69_part_10